MFRNIAAAAWRSAMRDRLHAGLNIVGLAIGLAAAILIGLFARDELSFDRDIPGVADVYRVQLTGFFAGHPPESLGSTQWTMAPELKLDFPEIKAIGRWMTQPVGIRHGNVESNETAYATDASLLQAFPVKFIRGTSETALEEPDTVVLSKALAIKYFGTVDCLGQTLEIDHAHTVRVTGVMADTATTNFHRDLLLSGASNWSALAIADQLPKPQNGDLETNVETLLRLAPGTDVASLRSRLDHFAAEHYGPDPRFPTDTVRFWLMPVTRLHLSPSNPDTRPIETAKSTLESVVIVGILTLLVAGVNFVNLMTARATRRAVEVGVRKALGATRAQLIRQFMAEALAYAFFSLVAAMAIVELVLPSFNAFLHRTISFAYWRDPALALSLVLTTLLLGLLAGIYPALVQSSFRPAATLKGSRTTASGSGRLRQALVVAQFAVSIGLIIATAIIYQQTLYATRGSLQFATDQIVTIPLDALPGNALGIKDAATLETLKQRLATVPGVIAVSGSRIVPADNSRSNGRIQGLDTPTKQDHSFDQIAVDYGFLEVLGIKPLAGRSFDEAHHDDALTSDPEVTGSGTAILNMAAVRALGFTSAAQAIGHHFQFPDTRDGGNQIREIVGVVPDVQFTSVRTAVEPTSFLADPKRDQVLSVRVDRTRIPEALAGIDRVWSELVPSRPIKRVFLDDKIEQMYQDLEREGAIFAAFAIAAVVIGCFGLFGLSAFTAARRTKEVGIRKALGASVPDIVKLMVWQFIRPVVWANLIAWPLAWLAMRSWLDGFAYRIPLGPKFFLVAGVGALVVATLTTAFHAVKAARSRPVRALRYE